MVGNLGAEGTARCLAEPEVLCSSAATSPLLHVAYKPFTGRHSPGEYLPYGYELPGGERQRAQLKLRRGKMSVQQAGTDIRVLRELEDFPLVEAPLAALRARRGNPGRPAGLPVRARAGSAQRTGADAGPRRHGRDDRMAFLDHPAGAVRLRYVRQVPGDGAVGVHHELRPGSSPGPRLLRPVLQTRRIPAHARRPHATLGTPGRKGE
jgi:hypothetical protein